MARLGEKHEGMSIPKFGGWDHKAGQTNYSMVFTQARAKKKQTRTEGSSHFKPNPDSEELLKPPHYLNPPPAFYAAPPLAQPHNACVFQAHLYPKAAQYHQKNNSNKCMKRFMKFFTRCMCMRS